MRKSQTNCFRLISGMVILFIVSVLITVAYSPTVLAQGGFGGRPANPDPNNPRTQSIFIYTLDHGETKTDQVLLQNNSDQDRTIELHAVDGVVTNTGSYTCRQNSEATQDLGGWIKLSRDKVTLKSGESTKIDFTVNMPKNADVGEHNACITFQDLLEEPEIKSGISIRTRQAIRLVATVPGELKRSIDITNFSAEVRDSKQYLTINLKNSGNVSADTDIKLRLKSLFGKTVYENGGAYPVIPNQKLDLSFENDKPPFWGGWYRAEGDIAYDKRAGTFGVEDKSQLIKKTAAPFTVFIMPSTGALAIFALGALLLVALIVWLWLRSRRAKTIQHKWGVYTAREGDTIGNIAKRCGMNWKSLAKANKIKAPYTVHSGMKIKVPMPKNKGN